MNNYELAKRLRQDYPFLAGKVERARVDVGPYYRQHGALPFNGISENLVRIVVDTLEEAEPDSCSPKLLMAA